MRTLLAGARVGTVAEEIRVPEMAAPTVWLATPDGLVVIDTIAVKKAAMGLRQGWTLTADEARYTARILLDQDVPYSVVAARIGRSKAVLKTWFPGEIAPSNPALARAGGKPGVREPAKCGTRSGYGAHRRRGEVPCQPCRSANSAADRRYRTTGTSKRPAVAA